MDWNCIDDRQRLIPDQDQLTCIRCGRCYDMYDGIPVFTANSEKYLINRKIPVLEELWNDMQQGTTDEAARRFSQKYGLRIDAYGTSWYLLFPFPKRGPVLEIGAGFGDDTISLTGLTTKTITLVPNTTTSSIVKRRLEEKAKTNWQIAITRDISHLPFKDQQLEAIVMDHTSAPVFHVNNRSLNSIVKEWRRVLKPGGLVLLGIRNPYFPYKLIKFIRARSYNKDNQQSVNQVIKSCAVHQVDHPLSAWKTIRVMQQLGFKSPKIYAPLPDENKPEIVFPVEHTEVVGYFANYLVPKYSFLVKSAITMTNLLLRLRLLSYCLPYYYLYFTLPDSSKSE